MAFMTRRRATVAAVAAGGLLAGALVAWGVGLIAYLTIAVFGTMTVVALTRGLIRWPEDPGAQDALLRWALASLAVHLLIGAVVASSQAITYFFGPDALTYDRVASEIVAHWNHGTAMPFLPGGKEGYYYLVAGLYWVFGSTALAGIAVNAVVTAALVPIVSDTTYRLFGAQVGRRVTPLLVVVPGMLFWTSQLLKEAPFLFLVAVAVNCAVRLSRRFAPGPIGLLAVTLGCLMTLRGQIGFVLAIAIVAGVAVSHVRLAAGLVVGSLSALLVAFVIALGVGSSGYEATLNADLNQAHVIRQDLAATGSGFRAGTDISTQSKAVSFLPVALLTFTFGPLPWQLHGNQMVVLPDIVVWWFLVAGLWWGLRPSRRLVGRRCLVLVMPAFAAAVVIALVVGNYGTLVRERLVALVVLAPMIALGLTTRFKPAPGTVEPAPESRRVAEPVAV